MAMVDEVMLERYINPTEVESLRLAAQEDLRKSTRDPNAILRINKKIPHVSIVAWGSSETFRGGSLRECLEEAVG